MLDSPFIDVALALILFYTVLSLAASTIQEWVASLMGLRSSNLKEGVGRLLDSKVTEEIYNHPLIKNMAKANGKPSYIDPKTLSTVAVDLFGRDTNGQTFAQRTGQDIMQTINEISDDSPLKPILKGIAAGGVKDAEDLNAKLADWFDEGMSRIGGWYKRKTKYIIGVIAVVLTIATNASTLHVMEELWNDEALRANLAASAVAATNAPAGETASLPEPAAFPIGWKCQEKDAKITCGEELSQELPKRLIGWLLTIVAISLGAPFWFDLLSKVAKLKAAGSPKGGK